MKLREHGPAFSKRPLDTTVLNLGWYVRQRKWSQDKTSIPRRRLGNVIAAEVTVTSKRKVRSWKGAEPEWKQTLSCKCLKEVLQKGPYKHSLVPDLLASPFVLSWGWWLKLWLSRNQMISVPGKALSANEGLMFMICSAMQKSFNICLLLQEMVWVSVVMPTDCCPLFLVEKGTLFFLSLFLPLPRWKALYCFSGLTQNDGVIAVFLKWTETEHHTRKTSLFFGTVCRTLKYQIEISYAKSVNHNL